MKSQMVVMGRVVAPYGVYGWLKIKPDTETIDSLFDYATWWLHQADHWHEMVVETAKVHNDLLLVKFVGVSDRDAAFALKGQQVAVPRELLPPPEEGEYYWSDLIGLTVTNTEHITLGEIVDVFETGANDVIVVRPNAENTKDVAVKVQGKGKPRVEEKLLPFIADVVLEVDLENKSMLVNWDADF